MTQAPLARRGLVLPRQLRRAAEDGRAGASARRKYRQRRTSWRRRTWRRFRVFFGGYLVLVLAPAHAYAALAGTSAALYAAGVLAGVGLALFIAMRDMPPAHVAQWEHGAWAEQWTATELRLLRRRGWTVLNDRLRDLRRPEDVDHVVVGPAGTYVLDTKRWPGTIHVDDRGRATITSHDADDLTSTRDVGAAARAVGLDVHARLAHVLGRRLWVQAVVVLWGDFPQGVVEADRVVYVAGSRLRGWLLAQPPKSQRVHPDQIAAALRQVLPTA